MTKRIVTQSELKEQLHYDPETGIFRWIALKKSVSIGKVAGANTFGYRQICVKGTTILAHRLAWLYMVGEYPSHPIDHINGDKSDNRWCNLRKATNFENMKNIPLSKSNTSGFKGVSYVKSRNKWQAFCRANGKQNFIGLFDTAELAGYAYKEFAKLNHGEFYRETIDHG